MNNTIVFLGPSLPIIEAKKILPNAIYFPPIKTGDIFFAMRLAPKNIAIIDGYFEHISAVWHKEILFAMEKRINVFGASSMGALRAAELANYGMIGVGEIFEDFYNSIIIDDDEVAILHSPEQLYYQSLTDAMVNIRATMKLAVAERIVEQSEADYICNIAKSYNYRERILNQILKMIKNKIANFEFFEKWLNGNYVDQKKADAIELLETIALNKNFFNVSANIKVKRTRFFTLLHKNIMCEPFARDHEELSIQEKTLIAISHMKEIFISTKRLAHLLSVLSRLSINQEISKNAIKDIFNLSEIYQQKDWCEKNDCNENEKYIFLDRMHKLQSYISENVLNSTNEIDEYLLFFMKLSSIYIIYKEKNNKGESKPKEILGLYQKEKSLEYKISKFTAYLWQAIFTEIRRNKIQLNKLIIQKYSDKFRRHHNLNGEMDTRKWMLKNDMNANDFYQFIEMLACFKYLILENNLDIFINNNSSNDDNVFWLLEAAYLTGVYENAKHSQLKAYENILP